MGCRSGSRPCTLEEDVRAGPGERSAMRKAHGMNKTAAGPGPGRRVGVAPSAPRGAVVLTVSGPLDVYTAWSLHDAGASWDSAAGALVVDLRGATLIDSSGLRALVRLRNASMRAGLRLGLVGSPDLDRVLGLAGLDAGVVRGASLAVVAEALEAVDAGPTAWTGSRNGRRPRAGRARAAGWARPSSGSHREPGPRRRADASAPGADAQRQQTLSRLDDRVVVDAERDLLAADEPHDKLPGTAPDLAQPAEHARRVGRDLLDEDPASKIRALAHTHVRAAVGPLRASI